MANSPASTSPTPAATPANSSTTTAKPTPPIPRRLLACHPWRRLYLVASTIANYNLRYVDPATLSDSFTDDLLGEDVIITPLPAEDTER